MRPIHKPPGGWPAGLQAKALKGEAPITVRPGPLLPAVDLPAVDLPAAHADAERRIGRHLSEAELSSWLMDPKVSGDFAAMLRKYGPLSVLPTPVFFHGMAPGDEITIEIEKGKALVVRLQAIGETDDEGFARVFFELNGQPRTIKAPNRAVTSKVVARAKADPANPLHLAAPMPGLVASIAVQKGQKLTAGDVVLTIEAMKMETVLHAERDGEVADILVKPGGQIDAKDLLVVFA
jgi:pyruvate carboxylase